jgi:hypothetical protein
MMVPMRPLTLLAPVSALLVCSAANPMLAQAQALPPDTGLSCLLTEDLTWLLREEHAQVPVARGAGGDGTLVTVFAAETTGTWTIALMDPLGISCVLAEGYDFEFLSKSKEELALRSDPAAAE